jgi:hypothetical protein
VIHEVRIDAKTGKRVAMYSYTQDNRPDPAVVYPKHPDWMISRGVAFSMSDDWHRNGKNPQYYAELQAQLKDSLNYHTPYVKPAWSTDDVRECKLARIPVEDIYHLHYGQAKAVNAKAYAQCRSHLAAAKAPKAKAVPTKGKAKGKPTLIASR